MQSTTAPRGVLPLDAPMTYFLFGGAVFLLIDWTLGPRVVILLALVIYTTLVARQIHEQHVRVRDRETGRYRLAERRG